MNDTFVHLTQETEHILTEDKALLAYGTLMLKPDGSLSLSRPTQNVICPGYIITGKSRVGWGVIDDCKSRVYLDLLQHYPL